MSYSALLFLPCINFLVLFFRGSRLGYKGSLLITTILIGMYLLLAYFSLFFILLTSDINMLDFGVWLKSGSLVFNFRFIFDSLSTAMLSVVATVSFVVHVYSYDYMKEDPYIIRFLSYLSLFTFFMNILIVSTNFGFFLFG